MNPETFSRLNSDPLTPSLTIGSAFGARGETLTPIFTGKNSSLAAIQRFQTLMFTYCFSKGYNTSDQQLRATIGCLRDVAATWAVNFLTSRENINEVDVDEFWRAFSERFGQSYNTASLNKQLSSLRQSGSIEDYITRFNYLASAYDTGESTLMDFFINGLNENLRIHVSIMRDSFLQQHLPVSLNWVQTSATRIAATMQPVMHGQSNFNRNHKKFNNSKPSYSAGFSNHTNRYAKSYNNNRFNKPHFNNRNFHNQGNNRPFSNHSGPEKMDLDHLTLENSNLDVNARNRYSQQN